jgi:hypothetical protein
MKPTKKPGRQVADPIVNFDDVFGNQLTIPEEVEAEMKRKGWEPHWLDAKSLHVNQGYHPKGWKVYRRDTQALGTAGTRTIDSQEFRYGSDPDGVIRRGTLILGYKTSEEVTKHRAYLKQRADRQSNVQATQAKELRKMVRDSGLASTVIEGDDD